MTTSGRALGMHRIEWPDDDSMECHLGFGDRVRLLRSNGFDVGDVIETRTPEGATTSCDYVTNDRARRWLSEEVWKARKRG